MLTRRFFLAQIAALSAAEGASSPWKLATGLNGFGSSEQYHGKKYDYDEILEFTRDEGFQGIEAWRNWRGGYPDPDDAAGVREMREKVESYGLQIFSIQAGGPRGVNPVTTDIAERANYTDSVKCYVDLAVKLGCDAMGLWQGGRQATKGLAEDEWIERFAAALKPAAQYAVDEGDLHRHRRRAASADQPAVSLSQVVCGRRHEGLQGHLRSQPLRRTRRRQGAAGHSP